MASIDKATGEHGDLKGNLSDRQHEKQPEEEGDLSRSPETSAKQQSEKEYREHHATTPKPTSIKEPERDLQNRIQGAHESKPLDQGDNRGDAKVLAQHNDKSEKGSKNRNPRAEFKRRQSEEAIEWLKTLPKRT